MRTIKLFFSRLVPVSTTSDNAKVVEALRSMSVSLLIVGLVTSWLGIAPFVFSMVTQVAHPFVGWVVCILCCCLISWLIDSKIGVFVPEFFTNLFNGTGWINAIQTASLCLIAVALSYITMSLSSYGGEMTVKLLFEADKPQTHSAGHIHLDSVKRAREGEIRKNADKELATATATDATIKAEAAATIKAAEKLAAKNYPSHANHDYHRREYYKIVDKAKVAAKNHAATATYLANANDRMHNKIADMNAAFAVEQEAKEAALKHEWDEYRHRLNVANIFLSDLGWWATPLFWLITALTVLQTLPKKKLMPSPKPDPKPHTQPEVEEAQAATVRPFSTITKHVTQNLQRLYEAVTEGKPTATYAKSILDAYEEASTFHSHEFAAMQKRHGETLNSDGTPRYPIYKKQEVECFL